MMEVSQQQVNDFWLGKFINNQYFIELIRFGSFVSILACEFCKKMTVNGPLAASTSLVKYAN